MGVGRDSDGVWRKALSFSGGVDGGCDGGFDGGLDGAHCQ